MPPHDGAPPLEVLAVVGNAEVLVGRVPAGSRCDLALVDDLLRLHLALLRRGGSIVLRNPTRELVELLDLVGLAHRLGVDGPGGSPVSPG